MHRLILFIAVILIPIATAPCYGQVWEVGGGLGYGFHTSRTVTRDGAEGDAGFKRGMAVTAVAAHHPYRHLSGEVRYTFQQSDLRLSSGGTKTQFAGQSHAIHYDFLLHPAHRGRAVRPFFAAGAGAMVYRGTGQEVLFQPLSNLALLTRTRQVTPLVSLGAGIRATLSRHAALRVEFRDYITPFPTQVIAPVPGAKVSGWLHNFVPMVGISGTF